MRSRAVSRPLLCWLSTAFGPPPSRIVSSWLRRSETRSARKRILASKRGEVASTRVSSTVATEGELDSVRSAMPEGPECPTVYQAGGNPPLESTPSTPAESPTSTASRYLARSCLAADKLYD